jgi:DNA repair exonuclease SbcCD ATPase subunit
VTDDSEGLAKRALRLVGREEESEDERLLNLFRNRAELKKEFSDLQQSLRLAEERLASQEAATRRAEERLESIEQLLAQPGTGYTALVYFQLRALWRVCQERLRTLSDELRGRHEDRLRREELMRFNQEKQRELAGLDQQLAQARDELEERRKRRNALLAELERLRGPLGFLRRRKLKTQLEQRRGEVESSRLRLSELQDRRNSVHAAPWPEFTGLDIAAKREINIMVIAAAQELYLHFAGDELARKARDARVNSVQEMRYGGEEPCKLLIEKIQGAIVTLGARASLDADIQARARMLTNQVKFRSERETVPMAASLARIELPARPGSAARRAPLEVNVLAEEFWDLYEVFIP